MHSEMLSLYSAVYLPRHMLGAVNEARLPLIHIVNKEAALYGYTMSPQLMDGLSRVPDDQFKVVHDRIMSSLEEINGAHNYGTLFRNFPHTTPEENDYLLRRVVGYLQNAFGRRHGMQVLSCGHAIDKNLFNLDEFGACPICQEQVPELNGYTIEAEPFKRVTPLRPLFAFSEQIVAQKMTSLLARMASLSSTEKKFVQAGIGVPAIAALVTYPKEVFKETLPFLYAHTEDLARIGAWVTGATDILRFATYVSDPDAGDLSLASNTKFRLPKSHRRRLLTLLDRCEGIAPDMMRHREKWLRLGEELRPGSAKNRLRYPVAFEAFDALRNRPGEIATYNRAAEKAIRSSKLISRDTMQHLASRPGDFFRRLDAVSRRSDLGHLLEAVGLTAPHVSLKMLFEMQKYYTRALEHNVPSKRLFIPKGNVTKIKMVEDQRPPAPHATMYALRLAISNEIDKRLRALGNMGSAYIDPALRKVVLPFNTRGVSNTAFPVTRGSAFPVFRDGDDDKCVRLFCYWKKDTDLDLSAMFLDDDFEYVNHVSFNHLRGDCDVIHSGDIQNGSLGASEYIDFNPRALRAIGHRYVAVVAISYRGEPFKDYEEAFSGFMVRDSLKSGEQYEPSSVQLKFELKGDATQVLSLIFDLEDNTVTFADIDMGKNRGACIESGGATQLMTEAVMSLPSAKPTVYDVLTRHYVARGGVLMEQRQQAARVFDVDTDVNAIFEEFVQLKSA